MDNIDETLANVIKTVSYSPSICAAAKIGLRTLNKYYSLTNTSENYRLAMSMSFFYSFHVALTRCAVLHPQHKLTYFAQAKWELEWIENARLLVHKAFNKHYALHVQPNQVCIPILSF